MYKTYIIATMLVFALVDHGSAADQGGTLQVIIPAQASPSRQPQTRQTDGPAYDAYLNSLFARLLEQARNLGNYSAEAHSAPNSPTSISQTGGSACNTQTQ